MLDEVQTLHLFLNRINGNCFYCGSSSSITVKSTNKQAIKHALITGDYCKIIFHKRTLFCNNCGKYHNESLGSFISSHGISIFLELAIMNELKNLSQTYKSVGEKYHVSGQYVSDLFDKKVSVEPRKLPAILSIDEIYARRLTETKYCCVLMDPIEENIIDVLYSRRKDLLLSYFANKDRNEIKIVKYIISDLNDTYRQIAYRCFYNIKLVADSFHVIKNISEAFRKIRVSVMNNHEEKRDISMEYWLLKKFNWMLQMNVDDIKKDYYNFKKWNMHLSKYQIIDYMLEVDDSLREAYYLKEAYRDFNRYNKLSEDEDDSDIRKQLNSLISSFIKAKTEQMRKIGYMLQSWTQEIINSFIYINGWRLSNSVIERYNGTIKLLLANSFGYTNFERARNRIIYSINKDEPFALNKPYKTKKITKKSSK